MAVVEHHRDIGLVGFLLAVEQGYSELGFLVGEQEDLLKVFVEWFFVGQLGELHGAASCSCRAMSQMLSSLSVRPSVMTRMMLRAWLSAGKSLRALVKAEAAVTPPLGTRVLILSCSLW